MTDVSRRSVLRGTGAVAAGVALAGCSGHPVSTPRTSNTTSPGSGRVERPNIVMIVADDIGYTDLGCFGGEIPTPNLDRLASGGRRFTQLLTNPMCCPSRAALLTGLYPTQTGVGYDTDDHGSSGYLGHLNDSCVTLAEVLGSAGYRTAISGKWHVSNWRTPMSEPPARGFDQSFCAIGGNGFFTSERFLNGRQIGISRDPQFYMTNSITGFARNRILEFAASGDPFFLYTAYTAPHFPLHAPAADVARFRGRYTEGWDELRQARYTRAKELGIIDPLWGLSPRADGVPPWSDAVAKHWQSVRMEVYAAQIAVMDRGIGTLLDTLQDQGILENTLVLFMGDNGACAESIPMGSRDHVPTRNGRMRSGNSPTIFPGPSDTFASYGEPWGSASATPFRKYKLWVQEGGICTPFIASWPNTIPAGDIDHQLLHLMDFMPSVVQLTGAHYPATYHGHDIHPMEGESFADALTGGPTQPPDGSDRWLFWEFRGHRAARHGRWKLENDALTGPWQLYEMVGDRTELTDLATVHPDRASQMAALWDAWKTRVGVMPWHDGTGYRPR